MPWHPIAVHFPIALLTAAVVVDVIVVLRYRNHALHRIAYALLVAGTVGAAASVLSGNADAADYRQGPVADAIQDHEDLGTATFLLFLALVLARLPRILRPSPNSAKTWVWLLPAAAGLVLLYLTSYHGGELVYIEGVGVNHH
jgi:uncharacterized membrane protein